MKRLVSKEALKQAGMQFWNACCSKSLGVLAVLTRCTVSTKQHFFGGRSLLKAAISTAHDLFRKMYSPSSSVFLFPMGTFYKIPFEYDCFVMLLLFVDWHKKRNLAIEEIPQTFFIIHGLGIFWKLSAGLVPQYWLFRSADRLTAFVITSVAASCWEFVLH